LIQIFLDSRIIIGISPKSVKAIAINEKNNEDSNIINEIIKVIIENATPTP
jgi:hypothetical protein